MSKNNKKFNMEIVAQIRADYARGMSQGQLSRAYRASITTIGRIVRNESWQDDDYDEGEAKAGVKAPVLTLEESRAAMQRLWEMQQRLEADKQKPSGIDWDNPIPTTVVTRPTVVPEVTPEAIAKRTEADAALQLTLAERTGLGLDEIKRRWTDCKGDREAIARLVNELHRPVPLVEVKLETFLNEGDPQ